MVYLFKAASLMFGFICLFIGQNEHPSSGVPIPGDFVAGSIQMQCESVGCSANKTKPQTACELLINLFIGIILV